MVAEHDSCSHGLVSDTLSIRETVKHLSVFQPQKITILNCIKFPETAEVWNSADCYFASTLVPHVCLEQDVDIANDTLVGGVYEYRCQKFGRVKTARRKGGHKSALFCQITKA